MQALQIPGADGKLLGADLKLLEELRGQIRETERWIDDELKEHPGIPLLESFPGIGKILSALIALEIDTIDRFSSASKLVAYRYRSGRLGSSLA